MAEITSHITPEELEKNYEYKVVKRALMKEYSWIKDVTFTPNELDKYNLIFLNLIMNPEEMGDTYGWEMMPWVKRAWSEGLYYHANFPSIMFNISFTVGKDELADHIEDMLQEVHKSPALPEELRLPKGRSFQVGSYAFNINGPSW